MKDCLSIDLKADILKNKFNKDVNDFAKQIYKDYGIQLINIYIDLDWINSFENPPEYYINAVDVDYLSKSKNQILKMTP